MILLRKCFTKTTYCDKIFTRNHFNTLYSAEVYFISYIEYALFAYTLIREFREKCKFHLSKYLQYLILYKMVSRLPEFAFFKRLLRWTRFLLSRKEYCFDMIIYDENKFAHKCTLFTTITVIWTIFVQKRL